MNPESLLHMAAEQLQTEAKKGPGTMFLLIKDTGFFVTRTPGPITAKSLVAKFDCEEFCKGLSAPQWASLLKKIWAAHEGAQKGDAVGK